MASFRSMGRSRRGPARIRSAVTLVELIVVVALIGFLAVMGAGIFTGALDYFALRRAAETLLWQVREAQETARARGLGAFQGVRFFTEQVSPTGGVINIGTGFSYLVYGANGNPPAPGGEPTKLSDLTPTERSQVVNIALGIRVSPDASVAPATDIAGGARFQFAPFGSRIVLDGNSPTSVDLVSTGAGYYFRVIAWNRTYFGIQFGG